ncbi:MAG TPA: aldehyde dehydrogenase [Puia sp.]|nr:aldehyde dehydrogenase [Puia sp.]
MDTTKTFVDRENQEQEIGSLKSIRDYYISGITRPYAFRMQRLLALKNIVLKYEKEISLALYSDLKKSPEETYAAETGLVLADINLALKNLHQWMRPRKTATNLVNFRSSSTIYQDPKGVVLIISPWNYPFQLLFIPLVGAIAAGNCVVLKPSELSPATASIMEKIIKEIFPPEYIRIIPGDGSVIVHALINSFRFDHIFYTGSIPVGKIIYKMAAEALIPVTLELGGKSPAVVEKDANIRIAARRIAEGKFINAGQTCVAPDYLLVHEKLRDKFMGELNRTIRNFFGENPAVSQSYGKIISEKRFDVLISYLSEGRIVHGGQHDRSALFIAPTIMDNISTDSVLMKEEIFGPILPVFSFTNMQEALDIIQLNPNPLSFYVFTADPAKEKAWIAKLPFGNGCVNNAAWQFANHHLPFGGIGNSGIGAYHGRFSFDIFSHAKPVMKTYSWPDLNIKYPPFTGKLKWFKLFMR